MNRNILIISMVVFLGLGCSRVERDTPCQRVTFSIGNIVSGDIPTKGTVNELLSSITPSSYPTLTVTSTKNASKTWDVEVGETIELPIESYRVTASYVPSRSLGSVGGATVWSEPAYDIDETIDVVAGQESVMLTGEFTCWALVIDYATTASYKMSAKTFNFVTDADNDYGALFIKCSTTLSWDLIVTPVDDVNYLSTTFTITNKNMKAGKWYMFSAMEKTEQEGAFYVSFPEWEYAE